MLLTVSKRLEFSASRRLFVRHWTKSENLIAFGPESRAIHGTGRNYMAFFVFSGPVNPTTGMLINISEIKERAGRVVNEQFDHKFLNEDNPAFAEIAPTPENIARQLYIQVSPLFADVEAKLVVCHINESPERSATYYANGACDANYWFEFSAARRTISPLLSQDENAQLFGQATSLHGHNYRARLSFRKEPFTGQTPLVRHDQINRCLHSLRAELDHRYLNEDVPAMKDRPMTTESLAEYIYQRVNAIRPLQRVRLQERHDFFAEVWDDESCFLALQVPFSAAHRLHVREYSDEQNAELFGKCNNPQGHGHRYVAEATVGGTYDKRTGALYDFAALQGAITDSVGLWDNQHLDLDTEDFCDTPSTGENIVRALWPKIDQRVQQQLVRLRLWETPNNRFTVRRTP
jgi:6-pyruvoyltetrahydropterin/6-carboxytetrahydropterin synthase